MARYGMVIDLQKCVGCGACALACKTENNTQNSGDGQTFNWADFTYREEGKFPKVMYAALPVLCNHCSNAPCVEACPVKPDKAMFKTPEGITMHNDERCIGCRRCQKACPYSAKDVGKERADYSVISYNKRRADTHPAYTDDKPLIPGCTASGAEVAAKVGSVPPHATQYDSPDYRPVREDGVVEKCILCAHRLASKEQPYCVASCPAGARTVGDLDDPNSDAAKLLKATKSIALKPEEGTEPNVRYIRSFSVRRDA